jgi:outer membrane murein-binding lipoprotein Lpp
MRLAGLSFALIFAAPALAQDVPGIEICTAEKTMERRTGCLQSNIDFLKQTITKASLESQQRTDAANRQIETLKAAVANLQKKVEELQAAKEPPKDASKPSADKKAPSAK